MNKAVLFLLLTLVLLNPVPGSPGEKAPLFDMDDPGIKVVLEFMRVAEQLRLLGDLAKEAGEDKYFKECYDKAAALDANPDMALIGHATVVACFEKLADEAQMAAESIERTSTFDVSVKMPQECLFQAQGSWAWVEFQRFSVKLENDWLGGPESWSGRELIMALREQPANKKIELVAKWLRINAGYFEATVENHRSLEKWAEEVKDSFQSAEN